MTDDVTELHNDLLRRAEACDALAQQHDGVIPTTTARCDGKASAYRHAAELLRATLARVEAAAASVASLPWPLPAPTREERDAMPAAERAVRDAVEQWRRLAEERGAEVERLSAGRDEVMDALVVGAESVAKERDALRQRAREATQAIVAAVGADGPMNIEEAAARIVSRFAMVARSSNDAVDEANALRSLLAAATRGELPRCGCWCGCSRLGTHEAGSGAMGHLCDGCLAKHEPTANDRHDRGDWRPLPHAAALRAAMGGAP